MTSKCLRKIVLLRLRGYSVQYIAGKAGVSHQTVAMTLNALPGDKEAPEVKRPEAEPEKLAAICEEFYKNRNKDAALKKAMELGISKEDTQNLFDYLVARRRITLKSEAYPAVTAWMIDNNMSVKKLAESIGEPQVLVGRILSGKEFMTPEIAAKISELSGLTCNDIFGKQLKSLGENEGVKIKRKESWKEKD